MKTEEEMKKFLTNQGYFGVRQIDGKWIGCLKMLFTTALCIDMDDIGYARRYDYEDTGLAVIAAGLLQHIDHKPLSGYVKSYGVEKSGNNDNAESSGEEKVKLGLLSPKEEASLLKQESL